MTLTTLQLSEPFGTLSYRVAGQGEPVVLIHGVGMQSAAWGPQLEALSAAHRVIALDMPGHGGSSPLPEGAQLPVFVDWFHAALEALELGRVSLVGHSMGALVATGFAVTYPEAVIRVALLNGVYCRRPAARAAVEARADEIKCGSFDLETPLNRWFGDNPTEKAARRAVEGWLSEINLAGYATAYGAFARGDRTYADQLSAITCPFLAITGDGDLNSTPAMAQQMAAAVVHGQSVIIEGHRHLVNLTASDQVNVALQDWLTWDAGHDPV